MNLITLADNTLTENKYYTISDSISKIATSFNVVENINIIISKLTNISYRNILINAIDYDNNFSEKNIIRNYKVYIQIIGKRDHNRFLIKYSTVLKSKVGQAISYDIFDYSIVPINGCGDEITIEPPKPNSEYNDTFSEYDEYETNDYDHYRKDKKKESISLISNINDILSEFNNTKNL